MKSKELRNDLLRITQKSRQWLSYKKKGLVKKAVISADDALCLIAYEEGLPLEKYLTSNELDRIREILKHLGGNKSQQVIIKSTSKKSTPPSEPRIIKILGEQDFSDPLLPVTKLNESREMASVYPLLYILENSIREFIVRSMEKKYGIDWWNYAPRDLRDTANKNMSNEKRNSWHQRRGARQIDYIDFIQLVGLVRVLDKTVIPDVIPSIEWFSQLVTEVYQSRCVLCHMNPLDKDSIASIRLKFRQWQKQMNAKKDLL